MRIQQPFQGERMPCSPLGQQGIQAVGEPLCAKRARKLELREDTAVAEPGDSGDLVEEVSKLKREVDGEILVPASIQLVRTLLEHDLADELRLMVFPVVLGAGERLFGETSDKKPLRLVGSRTLDGELAYVTYERA
jgi:dihydrofolate reductase